MAGQWSDSVKVSSGVESQSTRRPKAFRLKQDGGTVLTDVGKGIADELRDDQIGAGVAGLRSGRDKVGVGPDGEHRFGFYLFRLY
jgi:hypothetical protein